MNPHNAHGYVRWWVIRTFGWRHFRLAFCSSSSAVVNERAAVRTFVSVERSGQQLYFVDIRIGNRIRVLPHTHSYRVGKSF
jgi:hypothetical protein